MMKAAPIRNITYVLRESAHGRLKPAVEHRGYSNGKDLFEINSKELNVTMEAYSSEPGCAFQEHYIYNHGECLEEECVDYRELYYDTDEYSNFEAFKHEYDIPDEVTEDDLDGGGNYCEGGFEDWTFTI